MDFTEAAVAKLMRCQYELAAVRDPRKLRHGIVSALSRAVDCEMAVYLTVDTRHRCGNVTSWPTRLPMPPVSADAIDAHRREHPMVTHLSVHRAVRAWRLADVPDGGRFATSKLYRAVYQALPARHQLVMRLASPDGDLHLVGLGRSHLEFDRWERRGLELLWPSLVACLRGAMRARHYPGASLTLDRVRDSRGVVMVDDHLRVELCTEQARLWLAEYFPAERLRHFATLPSPVEQWARKRLHIETIGRRNPQTVRDPLVQSRGERFLSIDLVVDHAKGEHLLILAEEALASPTAALGSLGLTSREAEVLSWVAQGKNNVEIGMILGVSARTVQKHLEHIFQKMGVESRTAATLRAWQASRYAMLERP
jgi:DNA-binding CsgD family transcriptional regulator